MRVILSCHKREFCEAVMGILKNNQRKITGGQEKMR